MEEIRWKSSKVEYENYIRSRQQRIEKDRQLRPPKELTEKQIIRLIHNQSWKRV